MVEIGKSHFIIASLVVSAMLASCHTNASTDSLPDISAFSEIAHCLNDKNNRVKIEEKDWGRMVLNRNSFKNHYNCDNEGLFDKFDIEFINIYPNTLLFFKNPQVFLKKRRKFTCILKDKA